MGLGETFWKRMLALEGGRRSNLVGCLHRINWFHGDLPRRVGRQGAFGVVGRGFCVLDGPGSSAAAGELPLSGPRVVGRRNSECQCKNHMPSTGRLTRDLLGTG